MHIFSSFEDMHSDVASASDVLAWLTESKLVEKMTSNDGGLKVLGAIAFVQALLVAKPKLYVELGAWKGLSAYIAKQYCPTDAQFFIFDPDLSRFNETVEGAKFSDRDWACPAYMAINNEEPSFVFADDHQDIIERLTTAWLRGYNYVLFDDDYGSRADHRTFRNFILEHYNTNASLRSIIDVCVESVVLVARPKAMLPEGMDTHWRDKAFVKLRPGLPKGWTAGAPYLRPSPRV